MDYYNAETGELKYQIGDGLIIDQALAQWHANLMGLGQIYDPDKLKTALQSLYQYNFVPEMRKFCNPCRVFSLNGEAGTIMCAYPEGARKPAISVPYCEETMTGFEYAAAGLMIQEGMAEEGERMIAAVRDRYDGKKRNPFNEIECGNNYSRTMAAFAFFAHLSGLSVRRGRRISAREARLRRGSPRPVVHGRRVGHGRDRRRRGIRGRGRGAARALAGASVCAIRGRNRRCVGAV